jgi:hypothetical protein
MVRKKMRENEKKKKGWGMLDDDQDQKKKRKITEEIRRNISRSVLFNIYGSSQEMT